MSSDQKTSEICRHFNIRAGNFYHWKKQILGNGTNQGALGDAGSAVSGSGCRSYAQASEARPALRELTLVTEMKRINNDPELKCYGSPRVTGELNDLGCPISENTTARLMRKYDIRAKRKWCYINRLRPQM